MTDSSSISRPFRNCQRWSLAVGSVAAVVCLIGAAYNAPQFYRAYLVAFLFWWMVAVGCLGLAILHRMTGGNWGVAIAPFISAGSRTLPLIAVAFIPIALGLRDIYPWTNPEFFAEHSHSHNREWFLSSPFFLGRSAFYLGTCVILGFVFTWQRKGNPATRSFVRLSGASAAILTVVVSFAAIDWGMTLDPDWVSTLYGGIFVAGSLLLALCVITAAFGWALHATQLTGEPQLDVLHALGKLLLAFLMVWTYFEFSQFLIIYSGNLTNEVGWYVRRLEGNWERLAVALIVLHFVIPFGCLLSYEVKRSPTKLATVAVGIALVHAVKLFWTIKPSLSTGNLTVNGLDIAAFAALGGLWCAVFFRQLDQRLTTDLLNWTALETKHD